MNKVQALNFLKNNQPLPPDELLTEELIAEYDEVRKYFIDKPDIESIGLFLNSYGEGDGLGVYQLVEDVFNSYSIDEMFEPLKKALCHTRPSVRYWCAQVCANFPDTKLILPLSNMLFDDSIDIREAVIIALEAIDDPNAVKVLKNALTKEKDQELRELIKDIIK